MIALLIRVRLSVQLIKLIKVLKQERSLLATNSANKKVKKLSLSLFKLIINLVNKNNYDAPGYFFFNI